MSEQKKDYCQNIPCPIDGFRTNCPYMRTEKCPHFNVTYDFSKTRKEKRK